MSQGLQVFDEEGNEVFNSSTRTFKVIKRIKYEKGKTVTLSHPLFELSKNMTAIAVVSPPIVGGWGTRITHAGGNKINVEMSGGGSLEITSPYAHTFHLNDYDNLTVLIGVI